MIAIVAPEPSWWLERVTAVARRHGEVRLFAPWALPAMQLFPRQLRAFAARRRAPAHAARVPGWTAVELALRAWARTDTPRRMRARFVERRAVDALAANWVPVEARLVIAPSLGARRTFAAAARAGIPRVLVEDLPSFRELHEDLDRAAGQHPDCAFLRRYRAPASLVAAQEAERALASVLAVRSAFALERRRALGFHSAVAVPVDAPERRSPHRSQAGPAPRTFLLAGLATARSGVLEALKVVGELSGAALLVHAGEGAEPPDLLRHSFVERVSATQRATLSGVHAVLAPSWCEADPPEVGLAAGLGIPVVSTRRSAGFVDLTRAGAEIAPGDVPALRRAVDALSGWRPSGEPPWAPVPSLDDAILGLLGRR